MFRERINTPIDPIPQEYVNELLRPRNEPDYTVTSLGVALLKSRIEDYQGITGTYENYSNVQECVERVRAYTPGDIPTYVYLTYKEGTLDADAIAKTFPDLKMKTNISAFLKDRTDSDCLVLYHETKPFAVVIVSSQDIRIYHVLASFIPLYFPCLFKENPLTVEDKEIIKTLSHKEKDAFVKAIQQATKPYLEEFRRLQLTSLMKQLHQGKIDQARTDLNTKRENLNRLIERMAEATELMKQASVIYEGLVATEHYDNAENELVEYLSRSTEIHNLKLENGTLTFTVATFLNNYNEEAWRTFSERGYIYDGHYGDCALLDTFKERKYRKLLLDNLFSESPDFAVKMAGNYTLDLNSNRLTTSDTYDYENADPIFKDYIPNPHLKIFECLGGYRNRVAEALNDKNYVLAIELCIASAGSVDLDETEQTFRPFLGWLLSSTAKVLHRKDGVDMTPEEALLWLIDKEKKDETV